MPLIDINTKLMLHLNNDFIDIMGNTVTPAGNAQIDITNKKFGSGSVSLDGVGDYLSIPDSPDWDIFTNTIDDYILDCWARQNSQNSSSISYFAQTDGILNWEISLQNTGLLFFNINGNYVLANTTIIDNAWHHIALVKKGGSVTWNIGIYLDGIQVAFMDNNVTTSIPAPLWIGRTFAGNSLNGNIDEIRIQKANDFNANPNIGLTDTITVPTTAYTSLLPTPPLNLVATQVLGAQIDLIWDLPDSPGSNPIIGYKIERESPIDNGFTVLVADTGNTSLTYSDIGLVLLKRYNYRISAINSNGISNVSNEASAVAPSNLDTKLMLHARGQTGSTELINNGIPQLNPIFLGNARINTTEKKLGNGCLYLDGSPNTSISMAFNSFGTLMYLGANSFTIEMWLKISNFTSTIYLFSEGGGIPQRGGKLYITTNKEIVYLMGSLSGGFLSSTSPINSYPTDNKWHHIAVVYNKDTISTTTFLDGIDIKQQIATGTGSTGTPFAEPNIGKNSVEKNIVSPNIFIDEYIISSSVIYTGNFTSPTKESESGTALFHMNTQDESGDFGTGLYHIPNFIGGVQVDTTNKKFGEGSFQFDGNGDSISIPDSPDWDLVNSNMDDWIIETYTKFNDHIGIEQIFIQEENTQNNWGISHSHGNGFQFKVLSNNITTIDTGFGGEISDTNWHWVVLAKVGDKYAIYVDGYQVNYTQNSAIDSFIGSLYIANDQANTYPFSGFLDEIRIVKKNIYNATPNVALTDDILPEPTSPPAPQGIVQIKFDRVLGRMVKIDTSKNIVTDLYTGQSYRRIN